MCAAQVFEPTDGHHGDGRSARLFQRHPVLVIHRNLKHAQTGSGLRDLLAFETSA
jgi:hypothetical protein